MAYADALNRLFSLAADEQAATRAEPRRAADESRRDATRRSGSARAAAGSRCGRRDAVADAPRGRRHRRRDRRHQDGGRSAADGAAVGDRRQAAVRQGDRGRAARAATSTSPCTARRTCRRCCPTGSTIAATLPREDPRDALVLPAGGRRGDVAAALAQLGATPRDRHEQRPAHRAARCRVIPGARFAPIRGNVDTRLRKLDAGEYDALVLAAAGLRRLGLGDRISAPIPLDVCVPAPGQGIVAIEIRADDDADARGAAGGPRRGAPARRSTAERAVVAALGGGCQLPLGAHRRRTTAASSRCTASVTSPDGARTSGARADAAARSAIRPTLGARGWRPTLVGARSADRDPGRAARYSIAVQRCHEHALRLHRRRRPGRSVAHQRARPALPRGAPTSSSTTTASTRGCCAGARRTRSGSTSAPAAPKPLDQDAICFLLAEKAREGKTVVRLKWGDPFVFDSGGKEALFLHEQGSRSRSCPGIPARDRRPGLRGRPGHLSGRRRRASTLVRGHEAETDAPPDVDWARLAGLGGTLVCYAGARQIGAIAKALLVARPRAGRIRRARSTTATLPSQQTIAGHARRHRRARAPTSAPALLVVGAVAGLREHLRWFDDRPLFGRRIVVTRSREQAGELVEMLEERGAEAIPAPTIRIAPPEDLARARSRLRARRGTFDWIVFTSANARRPLHAAAARDRRRPRPEGRPALHDRAVDGVAARALRHPRRPDAGRVPRRGGRRGAASDRARSKGQRFLLPRADIARELLGRRAARRRRRGRRGRRLPDDARRQRARRRPGHLPDAARSPDRRRHVHERVDGQELRRRCSATSRPPTCCGTTVVASIGPVTAEAAQQLGIATTVMPERYTIPDLVDALVEHFSATAGPVTVP